MKDALDSEARPRLSGPPSPLRPALASPACRLHFASLNGTVLRLAQLHFCTDPRFGRCEESFGEDPALIGAMGVAAVTGLSGPGAAGAASTYIADPARHIATEAKQ